MIQEEKMHSGLKEILKIAKMPADEIRSWQMSKFKEVLRYHYENSKFYRDKLDRSGVDPEKIKDFEDIEKLPIIEKEEFRGTTDHFSVPVERAGIIGVSSGTHGVPKIYAYPEETFREGGPNTALCFYGLGMREGCKVLIALPFAPMIAGLGSTIGINLLGGTVIGVSPAFFAQIPFLVDRIKPEWVFTQPTIMQMIGGMLREQNIASPFKYGVAGGEPYYPSIGKFLEETMPLEACFGVYGVTEIGLAGFECAGRHDDPIGYHIPPGTLVEICDKEGHHVSEGENGTVIMTNLLKCGYPLIRYRIGDITRFIGWKRCECGLNLPTIDYLKGRDTEWVDVAGWTATVEVIQGYIDLFKARVQPTLWCVTLEGKKIKATMTIEVGLRRPMAEKEKEGLKEEMISALSRAFPDLGYKIGMVVFPKIVLVEPGKWERKKAKIIDKRV